LELTVVERLTLMQILPKEGNFSTLRSLRELREAIAFDDDADEFNLREEIMPDGNGAIRWDSDHPKEIAIPPKALPVIVDALVELDKQKRLTDQHYSLYEKFVGE
jgi:hypothetical protein